MTLENKLKHALKSMSITLQIYKKIKKHKHNYFVILYDNI